MKIHLLYCPLFLLLVSSCAQVRPLIVKNVTCCDLKRTVKTETEVTLSMEVYNPNTFPVNIKRHCLELRVNRNTVGTTETKEPMMILPNSTMVRPISVKISTQSLINGSLMMGLAAILGSDPTTLEIEVVGAVVGSAKGVPMRVRIREKYPLKLHP